MQGPPVNGYGSTGAPSAVQFPGMSSFQQPQIPGVSPQQPQYPGTAPQQLSSYDQSNFGAGSIQPNLPVSGGDTQQPGVQLPGIEDMDLSIQCDPRFMRCTVGKLVNSQSLAASSKMPLGIVCRPMAGDQGSRNETIPVVDFGQTGIIRCKRCRTYINPYVSWVENGRRWRCNMCGLLNDVPTPYFSHLDQNGQRRDRDQRPELSRCSVEFIAPEDYMVRPPQPPVYFFVIDVSGSASASGMLKSCVSAIKESLSSLPGSNRTLFGLITFDSNIHFYNLKSTLKAPQMLVVSDLTDPTLPLPEDLLVNLYESREIIDTLLDSLPSMFSSESASASCTGPAILSAMKSIQHIGGKLLLMQTCLPSLGTGSLKARENPRLLGTDMEHTLLNAEEKWYKDIGMELSRYQICVDTFVFPYQYADVASLSVLSRYTGGSVYLYPGFSGVRDGIKFEYELKHCLTRATAFEAVFRVRATRGINITAFYGNYFIRGTDLLALPNCTSDSTFALDLSYEDALLSASVITVQSALLYTSATGERRIRVSTMILPVTMSLADMVASADVDTVVNLLAKQSTETALKTGFENARNRVHSTAVEMIRASKAPTSGAFPGYGHQQAEQQAIPDSLSLLPLYAMSLQKSLPLRGGLDVRLDERAFAHQLILNMDTADSKVFIYPRLMSLHDMPEDAGEYVSSLLWDFKFMLNLSSQRDPE
jgi:protein transport protein SEC24